MQAARSALRRLATSHMPEKTGKHVRQMSGGAVSHEEVRGMRSAFPWTWHEMALSVVCLP